MKLFVGLGNPGKKYQNTRHNLGQTIVKRLVETRDRASLLTNSGPKATIARYQNNLYCYLSSFMNESGPAVQKILHFYKISPADLYLVHDDLDLGVGEYRLQFDRGPAGHHGVESVIQSLGTQAFNRIRIGIGKPTPPISPEDYVLLPFSPEELPIINLTIDKIIQFLLSSSSPSLSPPSRQ